MSRLRTVSLLAGFALATAGCGSAPPSEPRLAVPAPTPSALQRAMLSDGPAGLWPLDDTANATTSVRALAGAPGRIVEGPIDVTPGPPGDGREADAAAFTGAGRVITDLRDELSPGRAFTIELGFRADSCTHQWTQALGTGAYDGRGREGMNFIHYPRFWPGHCRLAVEFWKANRFGGGCRAAITTVGRWHEFALTYDGVEARCYTDGRPVGRGRITRFGVAPGTPFGIGGAGGGYAGTLDSASIADVAVFTRVLPAARIRRHAALMRQAPGR